MSRQLLHLCTEAAGTGTHTHYFTHSSHFCGIFAKYLASDYTASGDNDPIEKEHIFKEALLNGHEFGDETRVRLSSECRAQLVRAARDLDYALYAAAQEMAKQVCVHDLAEMHEEGAALASDAT